MDADHPANGVPIPRLSTPGVSASTRNHGHIGGIGKLPAKLERQVGGERAAIITEDAVAGWDYLLDLIHTEQLDVDYAQHGRWRCRPR